MTVEIALVHRVVPDGTPLDGQDAAHAVTPEELDAFLAERADWDRPRPAALTARSTRPRLMVACDGAYADFEEHALPVLERHGVHCVLFVVSDWAKGVRGPYEAALARALRERKRVEIPLEGWLQLDSAEARARAFAALRRLYKPLPTAEREGLVAALGVDPCDVQVGTFLGPERLRALSSHPLVTIGAHSRTHPFLPRLRGERVAAEIAGCKREIETWIGERIEWFAYPYGAYNRAVRRCVESAAFRFACGVDPGPFEPSSIDLLALPRTDLSVVRATVRA